MDIVSRVKSLNLPKGEYCVFGSGVLEINGIRKARDVDILVTQKLYKQLKQSGWKRKWFFWRTLWARAIVSGDNEAFTNLYCVNNNYYPNTQELISRADYYNEIPFLKLQDLLEFTKNIPYLRKKDKKSIELMEQYITVNSSSNIVH